MSSPEKFPLPFKPTNSWIIQRARELVSSDVYADIEQWLNNGDDGEDDNDDRHGDNATGDYRSIKCDHPAGEKEDYDPDYTLLSSEMIIRVIEAAAEMEAGYDGDNDAPEHRDDVSSSSSLVSSGYGYLPSDSLEEETLLGFQNLRDADAIDEKSTMEDIVVSSSAALPLPSSSSSSTPAVAIRSGNESTRDSSQC
ncbi:hypothetical protein F4679DRAFT_596989 [Xylaria curta]|nr:hypothetical protein F4679DRAFT_596989 [Xylaria curta]